MERHLANLFCPEKDFFKGYKFCKADQKEITSFAAEAMDEDENGKEINESVSTMLAWSCLYFFVIVSLYLLYD